VVKRSKGIHPTVQGGRGAGRRGTALQSARRLSNGRISIIIPACRVDWILSEAKPSYLPTCRSD